MLRCLKIILSSSKHKQKDKEKRDKQQLESIGKMQRLYNEAEVPLLCLSFINHHSNEVLINEANKVIKEMLYGGNFQIQRKIFEIFVENKYTKGMFTFLKDTFRAAGTKLGNEMKDPLSKKPLTELNDTLLVSRFTGDDSFSQISNILDMLKKMCDGCYTPFQVVLRLLLRKESEFLLLFSFFVEFLETAVDQKLERQSLLDQHH